MADMSIFGGFYLALVLLLYLIHFHGLHMVIFSEFYVLMFYSLMPVFLTAWDLIATPPGHLSAALSKIRAPAPRHGLAGGVPVLSYHEDRDKGCSPVDEKPAADRAFTDAATSCCDLRICTCTTIAALPAGSRSAFRLRRIAGIQAPGIRGSYYEEKDKDG